jgi:hypothetical protein
MPTGYSGYEGSQQDGQPIQLFKFVWGENDEDYYGYTDSTDSVTLEDGTVYVPVPIDRGKIDSNGTLDKSALKINTDVGTQIAETFRVYPPPQVVTLIIRQGHVGDVDEEFVVIWAGRIVAAQREHDELVMTGEPVSTSLRRPGLRRNYQFGCPLVLYAIGSGQCNADKASKTVSATVASILGATVTLNSGWNGAFTAAKFLNGLLEWTTESGNTERRTIIRVSGNVLSLSGLPQGLAATDTVDVVVGCNHQAFAAQGGDCEGLHVPADGSTATNLPNYGGQPWIPLKNPIGTYNNYY